MADESENVTLGVEFPEGGTLRRVNVPSFYATVINVATSSNSASLMFSKPMPIQILSGNQVDQGESLEPVAIIDLSPQTAKDLLVLLGKQIDNYERDFGEISTEYTRRAKSSS